MKFIFWGYFVWLEWNASSNCFWWLLWKRACNIKGWIFFAYHSRNHILHADLGEAGTCIYIFASKDDNTYTYITIFVVRRCGYRSVGKTGSWIANLWTRMNLWYAWILRITGVTVPHFPTGISTQAVMVWLLGPRSDGYGCSRLTLTMR